MHFNMLLTSAMAGLIPLLVGFIWYNPKVFGTAWMNVNGFTDPEKMKEGFNCIWFNTSCYTSVWFYGYVTKQISNQ